LSQKFRRTTVPATRLARLADFAYRRRGPVLASWIAGLVAAFALVAVAGGKWSADYNTPGSQSKAAADALEQRFPSRSPDTVDVVWQGPVTRLKPFLRRAARLEGIGDAPTSFQTAEDVTVARLPLTMVPADVPKQTGRALLAMGAEAGRGDVRVELGGGVIQNAEQGPISSEVVGLTIAAIILLLTLGTVVAAGLPLLVALFGLGLASALIGVLAAALPTPDWSSTVAAMLGIGVGIDYSLLILTRHRTALANGKTVQEAVTEAVSTAGRSVLIAGLTVVISLLGLFAMGLTYLYGVALAAIIAVLVVMVAAITLLPALLGLAGPRLEHLKVPGLRADPRPVAAGWSRAVQKRPWTAAIAGTAILLVLAAPATALRLGFPDAGSDRASTSSRQAYDLVASRFGPGANGPLVIVTPGSRAQAVAAKLRGESGIAAVQAPELNRAKDTAVILASPATSPQDSATEDLIRRLRDGRLGPGAEIGGRTAQGIDQSEATGKRLPLFIGGVVGLSLLLLLIAFRSVTVAIKAAIMNLLSVGAAYGVVAILAQGGTLGRLVGIDTQTPVPPFIPVIMFAVLFGLSMDYEVFLLSRVREEFLRRGDTSSAVTEGLTRTARVISAAAAIMVVVFGSLALSPEVFLKLIGLGLATAVLVDATIVRLVLVPAVMELLGDRNWWMPRWLERLIPRAGRQLAEPVRAG
jgi:RND superfamily putative drug exporter